MPFCSNCGQELESNVKFCSGCGKPYNSASAENQGQRKMVFDGEIHKCPQCGEVLNSFVAQCPACGLELRGTKVSGPIISFVEKIEATNSEAEQILLIRNFPIPNNKEAVLEFMILTSTNILGNVSTALCKAWSVKFEQSYQKAKILLSGDDLAEITTLYDETVKKIRANDIARGTMATGKAIGVVFSTVVISLKYIFKKIPLVLEFVIRNILAVLSVFAYFKAIQIDRLGENGVGYELLGGILSIVSALLLLRKNVNYFEILFVGCCGGLHFYLATFLENGAGLQLLGTITLVLVLFAFIKKVMSSN